MPYRFDPSCPFGEEARRVACSQLERARDLLRDQPDGLHPAIHQARRAFKRVRAFYRLVAVDKPDFRKAENGRLRDIAKSLSQLRDAQALIETLRALEEKALNDEERRAINLTRDAAICRRDRLAEEEPNLAEKVAEAIVQCEAAIEALSTLPFDNKPAKVAKSLTKGWRAALQQARQALKECRSSADPEAFHELRKAVQIHWRHLALLEAVWPSAIAAKRKIAKRLADLLGREHDIAVLAALLEREPDLVSDPQTLSHLLGILIREQQALRRESLCLAEDLFADRPKHEAAIIGLLWKAAASGET